MPNTKTLPDTRTTVYSYQQNYRNRHWKVTVEFCSVIVCPIFDMESWK